MLIADEPTSALDVCTQREVIQLLLDVCKDQAMALLYVSHDLLSVFQLCDRMLVVDKGQLLDQLDLAAVDQQSLHPNTRMLLDMLPWRQGPLSDVPRTSSTLLHSGLAMTQAGR